MIHNKSIATLGSTRAMARHPATLALTSLPDTAELESQVGYMLRRAQLAVFADFMASQQVPMTRPGQYGVLLVIRGNPGLTQTELSESLSIKRANLVPLLDQLEREGLVSRQPCPADRRVNRLHLKPAGERLLMRAREAQQDHEARITRLLGVEGRKRLLSALDTLSHLQAVPAPPRIPSVTGSQS
jgi:DNA-binding MarR family transcriptional regulator